MDAIALIEGMGGLTGGQFALKILEAVTAHVIMQPLPVRIRDVLMIQHKYGIRLKILLQA